MGLQVPRIIYLPKTSTTKYLLIGHMDPLRMLRVALSCPEDLIYILRAEPACNPWSRTADGDILNC